MKGKLACTEMTAGKAVGKEGHGIEVTHPVAQGV